MVVRCLVCLSLFATPSIAQLALERATYLGGSRPANCTERLTKLVVADGEVYALGYTGCDGVPGTAGGAFPVRAGGVGTDVYIARLSADLGQVLGATYYGGSSFDFGYDIAVTADAVYITGSTASVVLPGTAGGSQATIGGDGDAFVARFDRGLTQLVQATYFGGSGYDGAYGIAVDGDSVYLGGSTVSLDLPGVTGGPQPFYAGGEEDGFVARIPLELRGPVRSTYLGGSGIDEAGRLAFDGDSIFVAGVTSSADLPGSANGAQSAPGGSDPETWDAFVARLDRDLEKPIGSSYLGGSENDLATDVAVSGGWVYLVGTTWSADLPFTAGGAEEASGGVFPDAFVARFPPSLDGRVQATYFGAASSGVRLWAGAGAVVVAGTVGAGESHPPFDSSQAYVAAFAGDLRALLLAVAVGGSGVESGAALAVEVDDFGVPGHVFLGGRTTSEDLPATAGALQPQRLGLTDGFVARLSPPLDD